MSSCNVNVSKIVNKERKLTAYEQLQRTVMTCLLWEDNFYEDGVSVEKRITELASKCKKEELEQLVLGAKFGGKLRHVPLELLCCMARNGQLTASLVEQVVTRVDDMSELLSLYWLDGKKPVPNQMKKGLQKAFAKFDEYQFGKYKGEQKAIKLRDVIRIVRPKPADKEQEELWGKIVKQNLATPDTWEVELSKSKDKKESWTRLIDENRLGALALVRNLRNIADAGVPSEKISKAIDNCNPEKILPYQIFMSSKTNPFYEDELNGVFLKSINAMDRLKGKTVLLIDVSGSMYSRLSGKGNIKRCDAAACLASIAREVCEKVAIYTFNYTISPVPNRRGLALASYITSSVGGGTQIYRSICQAYEQDGDADRFLVFTDEQDNGYSNDREESMKIGRKLKHAYIVNVGPYKNGVCYPTTENSWMHISGFSENVIKYIAKFEH